MKIKSMFLRRERKYRTMRQELIISIGTVFIIAWAIIGIVLYLMIRDSLYEERRNLLESRVHNISIDTLVHIQTKSDLVAKANFLMNAVVDQQVQCAVIDTKGEIVAKVGKNTIFSLQDRLLPDEQPFFDQYEAMPIYSASYYEELIRQKGFIETRIDENKQGTLYMNFFLKTGDLDQSSGMIQLSTELTTVNALLRKQMGIYAILSAFMLCIVLFEIVFVTGRTLKPLEKMQQIIHASKDNMEHIGVENAKYEKGLQVSVEAESLQYIEGQKEVVDLAKVYYEMLCAMQSAFAREHDVKNRMRQFVSDASHELRTPLTAIHGFAEVLEMGAYQDSQQLKKGLKSIINESERMNTLVTNLLTLNRLDQNRLNQQDMELFFEKIQVTELIDEMLPQLQILASTREIACAVEENLVIKGQVDRIKQVVLNIFQNAVQHTSVDGGRIEIVGRRKQEFVEIAIIDNGRGIDSEVLPKIFDRFYRGEKHRSREEGGYGLGLAIVKSIMEQHHGEVLVESVLGKGTKVLLKFNMYKKEP